MKILVIGSTVNFEECKEKFGNQHQYVLTDDPLIDEKYFLENEVVFDFTIGNFSERMKVYCKYPKISTFLNTTFKSLKELSSHVDKKFSPILFGFCGLPTFLNRPVFEVCLSTSNTTHLIELCKELNTEFVEVKDRVGLVTPRVVCMIINEAYYTVEDGTATREDIDLAMKLGTNYPFGPFEWAQKIGLRNVYEVLSAVSEDTKDERYKICPLLRQECF